MWEDRTRYREEWMSREAGRIVPIGVSEVPSRSTSLTILHVQVA